MKQRQLLIAFTAILLFIPVSIFALDYDNDYYEGIRYINPNGSTEFYASNSSINEYDYYHGFGAQWSTRQESLLYVTSYKYDHCSITPHDLNSWDKANVELQFTYWIFANNKSQSNRCVWTIKLASITLNRTSLELKIDKTAQLTATVNWPFDSQNKTVSWSSNNSSVATVDNNGLVTAKSKGSAIITCKANDGSDMTATCTVKVNDLSVAINEANFPDANFRSHLLSLRDGQDGVLTENEIKYIYDLYLDSKGISNLKGIEFFTELHLLQCSNNQLTNLDLSKNTMLEYLSCYSNQLTSLDVSKNTMLTELNCQDNQLTSLDVSKSSALTTFYCFNNQLTSLDVSNNTALSSLWCGGNQLFSLDVTKNTMLTELNCAQNQLVSLDVSKNTALTSLMCGRNQLVSLDVSKNDALSSLTCSNNQLTSLDVSKNDALSGLWCDNNQLTSLDVSKNDALSTLYCYYNQLTSLDVSKNTTLKRLSCGGNQLVSLDVTKNTLLTYLSCGSNQLTSLDVSKNTMLTELYCSNNQLVSLDVSMNTALVSLECRTNSLKVLDVSKNNKLTKLYLYCNKIVGIEMDKLISGLPQNTTNGQYRFYAIKPNDEREGNICTKEQLVAVKAKGWFPCYYDSEASEYKEYILPATISPTEANAIASALGAGEVTEQEYYIKGKVVSIVENFGTQSDNATFYMSEDGTETNQFYVYHTLYFYKEKYAGEPLILHQGDEVVVCSKITNYNGNTPETIQSEAYLISINGQTNGILNVRTEPKNTEQIFSPSGQRLAAPRKGLNIVGGRKVVIK